MALAAHLRAERAATIEKVRAGLWDLQNVIDSDDSGIGRIKVVAILENLPGLGKVAARRLMDDIGISGDCRIRELSPEQSFALLGHIPR